MNTMVYRPKALGYFHDGKLVLLFTYESDLGDKNSKIAFIIGDENHGVSDAILKQCNVIVHIEMYGQNSSMNVVQATSIALYEFTKKLSKQLSLR